MHIRVSRELNYLLFQRCMTRPQRDHLLLHAPPCLGRPLGSLGHLVELLLRLGQLRRRELKFSVHDGGGGWALFFSSDIQLSEWGADFCFCPYV